jgi:hypothetical protein
MKGGFMEYDRLFRARAWSWAKTTGADQQELYQVAWVAYLRNQTRVDENQYPAAYLFRVADSAILSFLQEQRKEDQVEANLSGDAPVMPDRALEIKQQLAGLSHEARQVVRLLLEGPAEVLGLVGDETPRKIRASIVRHLRQRYSHAKSYAVMREVKEAVACM